MINKKKSSDFDNFVLPLNLMSQIENHNILDQHKISEEASKLDDLESKATMRNNDFNDNNSQNGDVLYEYSSDKDDETDLITMKMDNDEHHNDIEFEKKYLHNALNVDIKSINFTPEKEAKDDSSLQK